MAKAAKILQVFLNILQKKSLKERIEWGKEQREKGNEYYKQKIFEKV